MRRAKTTPGLSPQQVKHFAVVAVVLTGLLALFVSGEDWGAQAQVKAVEKRNDLLETERNKVGTTRLLNGIAVRPAPATKFGEAAGPEAIGVSGPSAANATVSEQPARPVGGGPVLGRENMPGNPAQFSGGPRPVPRPTGRSATDPRAARAAALARGGGKEQGDW